MAEIDKNDEYPKTKFDAYLGHYMNFENYLSSYENAFNALIDSVNNSGFHVDYLAYPILFIARHSLELGFKTNIRFFSKYSEKSTNSHTHNLKFLFTEFKIHVQESIKKLKLKYSIEIEETDIKDFEQLYKAVNDLIDKFDILDKCSFCFRYPVDNKNRRVFQPNDIVNILDIKKLFDKAMILIYHTADIFSKYIDYADFIEQSYEDEMRSAYGY